MAKAVWAMTGNLGLISFISRVAVYPSISGIFMSISTREISG